MSKKRHVALMRGINVGGKNKLPMAELVRLFEKAGCEGVRTYIASGNIVFDAGANVVESLPQMIEAAVERSLGLKVPVVVRSAQELRIAAKGNPFIKDGEDSLFVMFLADHPDKKSVAGLDPERSPGDKYKVVGRDIYLSLTTGAAKTKLTNAYFDSKLGTVSTGRNWRTVLRLVEMCEEGS
jgi:uncharacterized protein (DUF1697 family)